MVVAAILLAAGLSRRMGRSKPLLPLGDRTVIAHCIESIRQAGIGTVIVVTGPEGNDIRDAVRDLPVTLVINPLPGSEMVDSVRAGLAETGHAEGIFVCLSDYPLVSPETYSAMLSAFREGPGRIVIPQYHGRKGHPVLFPREVLREVTTAATLRGIIANHPDDVHIVDVTDEGTLIDMDTPQDYWNILLRFHASGAISQVMAAEAPIPSPDRRLGETIR